MYISDIEIEKWHKFVNSVVECCRSTAVTFLTAVREVSPWTVLS